MDYFFLDASSVLGWIVFFILFMGMRKRITRLESEMRRMTAGGVLPQAAAQVAPPTPQRKEGVLAPGESEWGSPATTQPTASAEPTGSSTPDLSARLIAWLQEDWLLKLGVLLLLIGFGWLVTYAFMNNWIGEMGRIVFGLIAGTIILAFGWYRMGKYVHQGGIFLAFGATVILLTIFAAREIYGFFTPGIALSVMFMASAFVALASVRYKTESLALLSIILGAVAPLLTNAPTRDFVSLYWYLLIVIAGVIWIVIVTGWRSLVLASLAVFALYSAPNLSFDPYVYGGGDRSVLLLFEYAVAAIIFVVTILSFMRKAEVKILPDMIAAGGNGLLLLIWILAAAPEEWKSLLIIAWMLVFVVGAFAVFRATGARQPFYIYAAVGITMLASATSVELQGHTLVIAYAIEAVAITVATYLVMRDIAIAERTTLLMVVPAFLSAPSFFAATWRTGVFHRDFVVLFIMSVALFFLGLFIRYFYQHLQQAAEQRFYPALIILGSGYAFVLVWLSLHAAIAKDDVATTFSLFVYTVVGLVSYFMGKFESRTIVQYYGGVLLGLVVLRLLVIDVWDMALAGRIITFFLVGAMLIGTAFIGRRSKMQS